MSAVEGVARHQDTSSGSLCWAAEGLGPAGVYKLVSWRDGGGGAGSGLDESRNTRTLVISLGPHRKILERVELWEEVGALRG